MQRVSPFNLPAKYGGHFGPPKTADWELGKNLHRLPARPLGPVKAWRATGPRRSTEESAEEVSGNCREVDSAPREEARGTGNPVSPVSRRPRQVAPVSPRRPSGGVHGPRSLRPRSAQGFRKGGTVAEPAARAGGIHSEPIVLMRARGSSEGTEALKGFRRRESEDDSEDWHLPDGDHFFRRQTSSFQDSVSLAKKHGLSMASVKAARDEFREFDTDGLERLTPQQFEAAMRKRCNLAPNQPIPASLRVAALCSADHLQNGEVTFEEFLLWSQSVKFVEETLVTDTKDRRLRQYARDHRLDFVRVERLERIFKSCDTDRSGFIEWSEFRQALYSMMKVKESTDISEAKLIRYWKEADSDNDGRLTFPEFLAWHGSMFPDGKTL